MQITAAKNWYNEQKHNYRHLDVDLHESDLFQYDLEIPTLVIAFTQILIPLNLSVQYRRLKLFTKI